jgi:hypothetical protein
MAKIRFNFGRLSQNVHDWRSGKGVKVRGPRLKCVHISVAAPSTGYRFIFYFPSGAWWHLDVVFDRRNYWKSVSAEGGK